MVSRRAVVGILGTTVLGTLGYGGAYLANRFYKWRAHPSSWPEMLTFDPKFRQVVGHSHRKGSQNASFYLASAFANENEQVIDMAAKSGSKIEKIYDDDYAVVGANVNGESVMIQKRPQVAPLLYGEYLTYVDAYVLEDRFTGNAECVMGGTGKDCNRMSFEIWRFIRHKTPLLLRPFAHTDHKARWHQAWSEANRRP